MSNGGQTCSYFYPRPTLVSLSDKKPLFGGYPTQEQVYLLESIGVECCRLDFGK